MMNTKIKQLAQLGYVSKGAVYAISGILAFSAAVGMGGTAKGKIGVLEFLQKQPFGNFLLGMLAIGLLCYGLWRFLQSIHNPEGIDTNFKGIGKRIGFFFSGLFYTALAIFSVLKILDVSVGKGNGHPIISREYLPYLFYALAIGLAIKAIFHLVKALRVNFLKEFRLDKLSNTKRRRLLKSIGYAGLISRGIVVSVVSYFFFHAAQRANFKELKGTAEAFTFLRENSEGPWLVGLVAFGLICYGLYILALARYRQFRV